MTHCSSPSTCSFPSIFCPSTLNILPSVCLPTGTVIPAPVAVTSISLDSPSLDASRIQRTMLFPICWAASMTSFLPSSSTVSASLISGRYPPSNSTSTTGPKTCTIFPFSISSPQFFLYLNQLLFLLKRFRAAYNLCNLLGDCRLSGTVIQKRQLPDHVFCTFRSPLHRHHTRILLAGK